MTIETSGKLFTYFQLRHRAEQKQRAGEGYDVSECIKESKLLRSIDDVDKCETRDHIDQSSGNIMYEYQLCRTYTHFTPPQDIHRSSTGAEYKSTSSTLPQVHQ